MVMAATSKARYAWLAACVAGWFAACSGSSSTGDTPDPGPGAGGVAGDAAGGTAGHAGQGAGAGSAGKDGGPLPEASDGSSGQEGGGDADGCTGQPEVCDGKDNNCDGNIDEGNPGGGGACDTGQSGLCKAGVLHCGAGGLTCTPLNVPKAEVCNGVDDDCDGEIDDGTIAGVGELCVVPGQPTGTPCGLSKVTCEAGKPACKQTFFASPEVCNGQDDDCNGTQDDAAAVNNQPCDTGLAGICAQGTSSCVNGVGSCSGPIQPGDETETCNGKDDNCDGQLDEMDVAADCGAKMPGAQQVAQWQCSQGACGIAQCEVGTSNANGVVADGCECGVGTWPPDCASAAVVAVPLGTGPTNPVLLTGGIPSSSGSAWFQVVFAKPALGTPYHFWISLTDSHGGEFKMNVRTDCTTMGTCSDDTGDDVATWETTTKYVPGNGCCADNEDASHVLVEVVRANTQSTCNSFTVRLQNY